MKSTGRPSIVCASRGERLCAGYLRMRPEYSGMKVIELRGAGFWQVIRVIEPYLPGHIEAA